MKAKWFSTFLVIMMLVIAVVPAAGAAPLGDDDIPVQGANSDNPGHELADKQAALKEKALEAKLNGKANGKTHEVARGQYVELALEDTDKIFVVRRQDEAALNGLNDHLTTLLHAAMSGHSGKVIHQLSRIVPTFKPHARPAAEPAARFDVSRRWPPDHDDAISPETAAPIAVPARQS